MAANKTLNRTQREERLAEVARLERQGWTQTKIAMELGVSQPQIAYDLGTIRTRYRAMQIEDRSTLVAEKVAQYKDIRREAWDAWERSKDDGGKVVEVFANGQDADGCRKMTERRIKRVGTRKARLPGNEYLQTILETLQAERDLLGLDQEIYQNMMAISEAKTILRMVLEAQREVLADQPEVLQAVQQRCLALVQPKFKQVEFNSKAS